MQDTLRPSSGRYSAYLRTRRGLNIGIAATYLAFIGYTAWRLGQGGIVGSFLLAICILLLAAVLATVGTQWLYMRNAAVWIENGYVVRRDALRRLHHTRISDIARVVSDPDNRGAETVPCVSLISASGDRLLTFDQRMWSAEDLNTLWPALGKVPE